MTRISTLLNQVRWDTYITVQGHLASQLHTGEDDEGELRPDALKDKFLRIHVSTSTGALRSWTREQLLNVLDHKARIRRQITLLHSHRRKPVMKNYTWPETMRGL